MCEPARRPVVTYSRLSHHRKLEPIENVRRSVWKKEVLFTRHANTVQERCRCSRPSGRTTTAERHDETTHAQRSLVSRARRETCLFFRVVENLQLVALLESQLVRLVGLQYANNTLTTTINLVPLILLLSVSPRNPFGCER